MKVSEIVKGILESVSHAHSAFDILSAFGITGGKKSTPGKSVPANISDAGKDAAKVVLGGFGKGDEMNFASMVNSMPDTEKAYFILFVKELYEKYPLKNSFLVVHLGTKFEKNHEEAINEAIAIARIRGKGNTIEDFEATLLYCDRACYTTDTNVMMLKAAKDKATVLFKKVSDHVDMVEVNSEIDKIEKDLISFIYKHNGKKKIRGRDGTE